jgi:hypothetical protein
MSRSGADAQADGGERWIDVLGAGFGFVHVEVRGNQAL